MNTIELKVSGMSCAHCERALVNALTEHVRKEEAGGMYNIIENTSKTV